MHICSSPWSLLFEGKLGSWKYINIIDWRSISSELYIVSNEGVCVTLIVSVKAIFQKLFLTFSSSYKNWKDYILSLKFASHLAYSVVMCRMRGRRDSCCHFAPIQMGWQIFSCGIGLFCYPLKSAWKAYNCSHAHKYIQEKKRMRWEKPPPPTAVATTAENVISRAHKL